jgi:hypothetical protein
MARKVTFMGTNGLGQVTGMHPAVGAAVSVGAGTATAVGIRKFSSSGTLHRYSELVGASVGILAGLGMMASPKSRAAGFTGIVATLVGQGLRFAEGLMSGGLSGGLGIVTAKQVPTLGAAAAYNMPSLGAASAYRMPTLGERTVEPRQLAGNGGVQIVGSGGIGRHFGATVMG